MLKVDLDIIKDVGAGILRTQGRAAYDSYALSLHRVGDVYARRTQLRDHLEDMGLSPEDVNDKMITFAHTKAPNWPICCEFDQPTMTAKFVCQSDPAGSIGTFTVNVIKAPPGCLIFPERNA